jgi:hypothetical protein
MARSIVSLIANTTAGTSFLLTFPTFETALVHTVAPVSSLIIWAEIDTHNLDATFVVNFLEPFQASAHEVFGVRPTVITLHVGEESRSTKAIPHRVGHKLAWINSPAVICIETDRFWARS